MRALDRLEASATFERSASLVRLLRFLIGTAETDPESLKEAVIGVEFYKRDADYDPRLDSIVRVNAMRLRQRLAEFYLAEGSSDPVRITLPRGSYVPILERVGADVGTDTAGPVLEAESAAQARPAALDEAPAAALPDEASADPAKANASGWPWTLGAALLAALGLLCAVALYVADRVRSAPPPFVGATFTQVPLTPGRDLEFEPAVSPDGKRLAYVTRKAPGSSHFGIFLRPMTPGGGDAQMLAAGDGDALYPAWSPDGTRIAFLHCGQGACSIATVPLAGGTVETVETLPRYELPDDQPYYQYRQLNPVWSADGKGVIFPYRGVHDDAERLVLEDLETHTRRQLTFGQPEDEDGAPALSADGKTLAFLRRHVTHTDVMRLDLASGKVAVLAKEPNVTASGLTWAHDGQGVVVGVNRRRGWALLWVPLHGRPRELEVNLPIVMNPVFSSDGNSLMVLAVNRSRNLAKVVGKDGTSQPVFLSRQRNSASAFSPDGKQLAFLSDRSGEFEVWLADRQGTSFTEPRQLTHGLGWYASSLVWSPDGQTLAVGLSNSNVIQVVDARTGALNRLPMPGLDNSVTWSPVWSSDARWIYVSASGERNGIFRVSTTSVPAVEPVTTGTPRELRLDGNRALYFEPAYGDGIFRVALDGSGRSEPVAGLEQIRPSRAWQIQDGTLFFVDVHDPQRRLQADALQSGKRTVLTGPLTRVAFADGTLSYLPKDRLLLYSEWAEAAGSQVIALRWK